MNNILDNLQGAQTVIISGHTRPDGDCVGSCLAMAHYIAKNHPEISVDIRLEEVPDSYRVIPGADTIITSYDEDKIYDLFIALDASNKERLVGAVKYFDTAKRTICIDHHISNPYYADENLVVADASSTCEVLADIMGTDDMSYETALALYVGIICDSGVFKHSNTGRHTMEVAGALMEKNIPYSDLIDQVFYKKTFIQNRLLGRCLLDSYMELDGKVIASIVERSTMDDFGAGHADLEGIIDQLRVTDGIEVAVLASGNADGSYKFSLRSNHDVDVRRVAEYFGGGGHVKAAGFTGSSDVNADVATVIRLIKEQI